jgi:virulence-associated protein VagC
MATANVFTTNGGQTICLPAELCFPSFFRSGKPAL